MMKRDPATQSAPLKTDPDAGYHYELSNEFYRLWLDPTMTYSCAYFATGKETLQEAQMAKIDLAFGKIGLKPGHQLLDIGCGWGAAVLRANERYGARAVGLTLSKNQFEYATRQAEGREGVAFRLEGWETYREPCDRIVSFGAFEHFGAAKYGAFFQRCRELLPPDGLMLVQTITIGRPTESFAFLRFAYFLHKEVFRGGEFPSPEQVVRHGREAGFDLLHAESLRPHYPRTIDVFLGNLERNKEEAIQVTDLDTYRKYVYFLSRSARYFRSGEASVYQFLFQVI